MATTYTTELGFDKPDRYTDEKETVLGTALDKVNAALAGLNSKNFAAATTAQTLTSAEARNIRHLFTNSGAAHDVKFPIASGLYSARVFFVKNSSGYTLTIKTDASGSTGVAIPTGRMRLLWINGNNVEPAGPEIDATTGAPTALGARVYHSANQSVANITVVKLAFDSERWDNNTIHDTSTNNTRLTCKTAGKYAITGNASFAPNVTGFRLLRILLNNTDVIGSMLMPAVGGTERTIVAVSSQWDLAVNDYIELQAYQDSGSSINLEALAKYSPEFMMTRIGS